MSGGIPPGRLRSLCRPRSVALVGASNKSNFAVCTYANLTNFGFADRTFLVNARGAETHGQSTYTSCQEIGQPVDLAHMMVPQARTLEALTEAAAAGVRNAVVLRSEEHTSELQSLMRISYAVFCLKKKKKEQQHT